MYYKSSIKATP